MNIKKGDTVKIISGNSRNKIGEVLEVLPKNDRIIVKGVNIVKKHLKASKTSPHGGIADKTLSINVSNAMLICPKCSKPARMHKLDKKGSKVSVCSRCKNEI